MLQLVLLFILATIITASLIIKMKYLSIHDWKYLGRIAVLFGIAATIVTLFGIGIVVLF